MDDHSIKQKGVGQRVNEVEKSAIILVKNYMMYGVHGHFHTKP